MGGRLQCASPGAGTAVSAFAESGWCLPLRSGEVTLPRLWGRLVNLFCPPHGYCLAGFQEGYPYPYAHTLFLLETASVRPYRFPPEQLRAKMIMFAFGSALAQARLLYGVRM